MSMKTKQILWTSLLSLAEKIRSFKEPIHFASIQLKRSPRITINEYPPQSKDCQEINIVLGSKQGLPDRSFASVFQISDLLQIKQTGGPALPETMGAFLFRYLPYCFLPLYARRKKKAVAVSHFAQSLDSYIAAENGESVKIGNKENFIHAHRMRALLDGVLIGAGTMRRDHPRLTVRHVTGPNPCRLIIGNSFDDISCLLEAAPGPVWLMGVSHADAGKPAVAISMDRRRGLIPTEHILNECYKRGLYSLYVEGGTFTTSLFLKENNLDIVQLHISPFMLGSGRPSFNLAGESKTPHARRFRIYRFSLVSRDIMFEGVPEKPGSEP
jgi:riboflavin-specific deaminase-like protein